MQFDPILTALAFVLEAVNVIKYASCVSDGSCCRLHFHGSCRFVGLLLPLNALILDVPLFHVAFKFKLRRYRQGAPKNNAGDKWREQYRSDDDKSGAWNDEKVEAKE